MTQQPSQNRQVLQKLDEISKDLGEFKKEMTEQVADVKKDVAVVKEQIKSRPEVDREIHKGQDDRIGQVERRIKQLEDNQRWLIVAVLGSVLNAIMQLVLH